MKLNSKIKDNKLIQNNGKDFRIFEIFDGGVMVEYKSEGEYSKFEVEFENIDFKEFIVNKRPNIAEVWLFISILFNLFFMLYFIAGQLKDKEVGSEVLGGISMGILVGICFWAQRLFKNVFIKHIRGNSLISFFYRDNEKEIVDKFIDRIKISKKLFIKNTFFKIDEHIPTESQKQTFLWLYQTNQIDKNEYEMMLEELENFRIIRGE